MKIALLHYSFAPVVGGVETIVRAHAEGLASHGMDVRVICGVGTLPSAANYELLELPELKTNCEATDIALLKSSLLNALRDCRIVICHNMLTMPFHNMAARVLLDLANEELRETRFIHWTHDIAARNPDYSNDDRVQGGDSVTARCHPQIEYVCISEERLTQLASLRGFMPEQSCVIPNGIDMWQIAGASARLKAILNRRRILEKHVVLFHPARLLPRKRVEMSVEIVAALKARRIPALLILSGAPDPHRPDMSNYAKKIEDVISDLDMADEVIFAGKDFTLDDAEIAACYRMCDVVVFPSSHEGFGLPVLEAAAHGKLLIASDIAPTRAHICGEAVWITESASAERIAEEVIRALHNSAPWQAKQKVIERFSWEQVFTTHLLPLLLSQRDCRLCDGDVAST